MDSDFKSRVGFFTGLLFMALARALFLHSHRHHDRQYFPTFPVVAEHTGDEFALLPKTQTQEMGTCVILQRTWFSDFAIYAYLAMTLLTFVCTVRDRQGDALSDPVLMFGTGVKIVICVYMLLPARTRYELQADSTILLLIPYLLFWSGTMSEDRVWQITVGFVGEPVVAILFLVWTMDDYISDWARRLVERRANDAQTSIASSL